MNLQLLSVSFLSGLLLAAVVCDVRRRRIPNALVLYGMVLGLVLQAFVPTDSGLLQETGHGLVTALLGILTGLALFLPFYVLHLLGAGDVKLLAMVGAWLGPASVLQAALWTVFAGALLATAVMAWSGSLRPVCRNLLSLVSPARLHAAGGLPPQPAATTGRLPYGVAIAVGSAIEMTRLVWAL
jgi:prepilin peptidase CpaA